MMSRLGIRGRMLMVFTVVHVSTGLVIGLLMFRSAASSVDRELESTGHTLACSIAQASTDLILTESYLDLLDLLSGACCVTSSDLSYAFAVDRSGRVLAHTFNVSDGFPLDLLDVNRADVTSGAINSVRLRTEGGYIRDFAAPVFGGRAGTIRLGLSEARIAEAAGSTLKGVLVLGVILYAAGAAGVVILTTIVTRPLGRFAQIAEKVSRGDMHPRIDIRAGGEVGMLAASFEHMLARLRARTEALAAAERMAAVGELAAGVAHEINNPLDGVQNCLRYLEKNPADATRRAEFVGLMKEGLDRIETVVRQLLTFAKAEKAKRSLVDVDTVVQGSLMFVEHRARSKGCRLTRESDGDIPKIWGDEQGLHQVVINLAMNAIDSVIQSGHEGGEVRVRTMPAGTGVAIEVADTGTGMPEEVRSRMFEPFFTTKDVGKGTGLGLSVSKNIVDAHGGSIEVETTVGKGSVFVVKLPLGERQDGIREPVTNRNRQDPGG